MWIGIVGVAVLLLVASFMRSQNTSTTEPPNQSTPPLSLQEKTNMKKPTMTINKEKKYEATLSTDKGDMVIELDAARTPITVNNFVTLAQQGFYNNTIFHRVIKGFMIQGGDPLGNGTGGPGYKFDDEPFEGEYVRGIVAMANAGPNTNGSQFFIMHGNTPLPKNYVIFGKVVSGMGVVDMIAEAPVKMSPNGEPSSPVTPSVVKEVRIEEQ